jgi:putative ABC transport system permease protein
MEIGPILRAMWRNKIGAALIAVQIAVTLAVVVNALSIINGRIEKISRPIGIDVDNIFSLHTVGLAQEFNKEGFVRADLQAIRNIPGVRSASPILNHMQSGSARMSSYRVMPEINDDMEILANVNYSDETALATMDIELLAGRFFRADEIRHITPDFVGEPDKVVVTESLGRKFFPEGEIVGRSVYYSDGAQTITIIGVIADVATAWIATDRPILADTYYDFMLQPYVEYNSRVSYIIRAEEGALASIIPEVERVLLEREPDRLIYSVYTQREILARSYASDRATVIILVTVTILMALITALGIVGLASFSVSQRTRQIGTRRALGARKRDILRYFFVENLLLTTVGVLLGGVFTYMLSYLLTTQFGGDRLDPVYYPTGVIILYILGLIAVFAPARRAAAIPAAVATRTV